MIRVLSYLEQLSQSKLQVIEVITLNVVSIIYLIIGNIYELLPEWLLWLVGLSIVFLNIAKGIKALRNRKNNKETTPPESAKGG